MELIQIIESTVFIFSLGLVVLLVLSFLLFKVKNQTVNSRSREEKIPDNVSITYEKPVLKTLNVENDNKKFNKRFIIINEIMKERVNELQVNKIQEMNSRFYRYNPGRNKIIKGLEYSRIKD